MIATRKCNWLDLQGGGCDADAQYRYIRAIYNMGQIVDYKAEGVFCSWHKHNIHMTFGDKMEEIA